MTYAVWGTPSAPGAVFDFGFGVRTGSMIKHF
jgi:hypothetical protein